MTYLEGDKVFIHSLGRAHEGKEYRGIIRGLAVSHITEIWIVEMVDPICPEYKYSCCTMPSACLRLAIGGKDVREWWGRRGHDR